MVDYTYLAPNGNKTSDGAFNASFTNITPPSLPINDKPTIEQVILKLNAVAEGKEYKNLRIGAEFMELKLNKEISLKEAIEIINNQLDKGLIPTPKNNGYKKIRATDKSITIEV